MRNVVNLLWVIVSVVIAALAYKEEYELLLTQSLPWSIVIIMLSMPIAFVCFTIFIVVKYGNE